ncbi:MAG: sugar lyase, partial [Alistipes sp.]|nr:sugar lyase [Alistipes sp.]
PEEGMDEIVIRACGVRRGEVYLDHIIASSFQDSRQHTADTQAPFINKGTVNHWLQLLDWWNDSLDTAAAAAPADAELRSMELIGRRFREMILEGSRPRPLSELRERFDAYGITANDDGTLRGKSIFFVRYAETYINMGHPDVKRQYAEDGMLLSDCNDLLFQLAVAHDAAKSDAERAETERMYIQLTRHLLDQGFTAGSALGTLHHLGYSMRNFYTAPYVMREVLRREGMLDEVQQAMEWFSGLGEVKRIPEVKGMDIDAFNTSLTGRLAALLIMDDSPRKTLYLRRFSEWADNGLQYAEGLAPCFKSDGTVYHHRRHYPAYAVGGFTGAVNAVWLFAGTDFAVGRTGHENLKRALLEMRFYCNLRSFPLALSGRHPDGRGALIPKHYARLAEAGSPDGSRAIDPELAAAYMRVAPKPGDRYSKRFRAAGIAPERAPEGCRVYGYNASLAMRRDGWLLTAAGHSRYLWSAEIYQGCNLYGRYLTHGSLQLLGDGEPVSAFGSGFRQEGWDWCHIPGTTAVEIPRKRMEATVLNVDTFSGYEEMLLSDETFCGGASHRGRNGAFGMILHEHDKYNGSLRARKSFFFFDNRVIALGSDIENDAEGGVHTTLFQNTLDTTAAPTRIDGAEVGAFPFRTTLADGGCLRDRFGNAWFVPRGRVCVTRERQHSLHEERATPTEGDFERAWIDHGEGMVRDGSYEYLMLVHPTDSQAEECTASLPYEVCACNRTLHAVRDLATGIYAAVAFEASDSLPGSECVAAVSRPCILLASRDTDGALTLSVADPDLALYEGESDERFDADGKRIERSIYSRTWIDNPSAEHEAVLTLRGEWTTDGTCGYARIAGTERDASGATFTRLAVTCREGATREIRLTEKTRL